MNVNNWLAKNKTTERGGISIPRMYVTCADGFTLSIQASSRHYCSPKSNNADRYEKVEVSLYAQPEPLLAPYQEAWFDDDNQLQTSNIHMHVPVEVVNQVLVKHGGIVE